MRAARLAAAVAVAAVVAGGAAGLVATRRPAGLGSLGEAARGAAAAVAQPRRARLACTPAVAVGARGEARSVARLGDAERATVLFQWPAGAAGGEAPAVRTLAASRGLRVAEVGRRGALAVTADGATVRALAARAPRGWPQLAAAGTRELCVLD